MAKVRRRYQIFTSSKRLPCVLSAGHEISTSTVRLMRPQLGNDHCGAHYRDLA